jgi:hypothetical protein
MGPAGRSFSQGHGTTPFASRRDHPRGRGEEIFAASWDQPICRGKGPAVPAPGTVHESSDRAVSQGSARRSRGPVGRGCATVHVPANTSADAAGGHAGYVRHVAVPQDALVPPEKVRPLRRAECDRLVPPGDYLSEHPGRAFLLIEVADSSLQDDRRIKGLLYAAAGVPEYWIVDVAGGAVEVHRDPRAEGYASVMRFAREAVLAVPGFEDVLVPVGEIVPPQGA